MYFDLNNNGVLDGSPSQLGEYAISALKKDATEATIKEYGWNGSQWVENSSLTPGLKYGFEDNGSSGNHLYNFEIQIPFLNSAPNPGMAYFSAKPGEEVGIMVMVRIFSGDLYWQNAGTSLTDPSQWGELKINTSLSSPRQMASLYTKNYVPNVSDGNIKDDPNWKYAFERLVTFTDFAGHKLDYCKIFIKESKDPGAQLYFGARITDNVSNNGDYLQIYFDQGDAGGNANYQLNTSTVKDDAIRVAGNDVITDLYFNGSAWVTDVSSSGSGGANFVPNMGWEFEISKPLNSGDNNDLSITSGNRIGILFKYYDADNNRSYWWSGTINTDMLTLDVQSPYTYSALGWGELVTGGPFVQPIYPEQNDIISGTYPLMLYAEDENGIGGIDSVDYRITDINDNIIINYSASTRLTKN